MVDDVETLQELNRQLRGVMTATGALNEAKNDPVGGKLSNCNTSIRSLQIRLADLHMQLADSYRGSAALRFVLYCYICNYLMK